MYRCGFFLERVSLILEMKLETLKRCWGEVGIAEIQILIALIMNPTKHWVINPSPSLFDGGHKIFDNSIVFHLAFPLCQIGIHIVSRHKIKLIIYAVLL